MSWFNLKKMTGILLAHYLVKEMHLLEVQILMIVTLILESTSVSASIRNEQSEQYTASCATLSPFVLLLAVLLSLLPLSRRSCLLHFGACCNLIKSKEDHAVEVTASQWMVSSLTCYPSSVWRDQWFSAELQNLRARPKCKTAPTGTTLSPLQTKFHIHLRAFCMCWLELLNIF